MTSQAENFRKLVKGNALSSIITALNMVASSVKQELMAEFKANSVDELAIKLQ